MRRLIAAQAGRSGLVRNVLTVTLFAAASSGPLCAAFYSQSNLVSDLPGLAAFTDTNLVGAWGVARSGTSPWWVNSTAGGVSVLFNGTGLPLPLVVRVPPSNSSATAVVFYGGNGFQVASNQPARFIFATLNGVISAWNPNQADRTLAVVEVDNSASAMYSGLTIAQLNGQDLLYSANFRQGRIDVFDTNFNPVTLMPNAFMDDRVPTNFTVFNVQLVGDDLFVTYAPQDVFGNFGGRGQGYVDVYDANGRLERRLQHGFWMNAPWGVTQAPGGFGEFSNHLLVGMFGSGAIAGFEPNGHFRGFLRAPDGLPLRISKGLWGLGFGNGATAGPTNTLYFASDFAFARMFHGLFGSLTAVPGGDDDSDGDSNQVISKAPSLEFGPVPASGGLMSKPAPITMQPVQQ